MLLHYAFILEQVVLVTHKMEEHTWQNAGGMTTTETWMGGNESLYWRVTKREREHKKQTADEWEETRHCYSTYKDCSGWVHQTVQDTKRNTANMHRQWKLTVNSQNRVVQPRHRTQASYISTVSLQPHCLLERGSIPHLFCGTQKQGQWCNSSSPNSHEDRQKQGIQHAQ